MQFFFPIPSVIPAIRQGVYVNQVLTNLVCTSIENSAGVQAGRATFILPRHGYDDYLPLENASVQVFIHPYGVVWRGFMTSADWDTSSGGVPTVYAFDYRSKLEDVFFAHDYNWMDTSIVQDPATARGIARQARDLYMWWATLMPNDLPLYFDLASFPSIVPAFGEVRGQSLLSSLQQVLESIDYRYRIAVRHTPQRSELFAFLLGNGPSRSIQRNRSLSTRPANCTVRRSIDSSSVLTHVFAEGAKRVWERIVPLEGDWVPENAQEIINAWEKYTTREIAEQPNPSYQAANEQVASRYRLPLQVDGPYARRMPVTSLVQKRNGETAEPFLKLVKYRDSLLGDSVTYKLDGISVENDTWVITDEPLRFTSSRIVAAGNTMFSTSSGIGLDDVRVDEQYNPLVVPTFYWWLYNNIPYHCVPTFIYESEGVKVSEVVLNEGNLFTLPEGDDPTDWILVDRTPILEAGQSGVGLADQKYKVQSSKDLTGQVLVLSYPEDWTVTNYNGSYQDADVYNILKSEQVIEDEVTYQILTLDTEDDLESAKTHYFVTRSGHVDYHLFDEVWLQAGFISEQRLSYLSPNLSDVEIKKVMYISDDSYVWETVDALALDTWEPLQSDYNQLSQLQVWALSNLQGAQYRRVDYDVSLPYCPIWNPGDTIIDIVKQPVGVTSVTIDLIGASATVRAESA